jgi:hypothetical protein
MAKATTTDTTLASAEPVVTPDEPTTLPSPVAESWFAADPFSATLAASPNWPAVPPMEPSAAAVLATAPKQPTTPTK